MNLLLILLITVFMNLFSTALAWHTPPDKWKEPRIFHTPFEREFEGRIVLKRSSKNSSKIDEQAKRYSPNGSYWYSLVRDASKDKQTIDLFIFNERDYLLQISILNPAENYETRIYWVNEKLLYLQIWWGRILGSYLILDVEREKIILKEMVNEGSIPFFQWKER